MATKSITIQFSAETLQAFALAAEVGDEHCSIIAFKAVSSAQATGYPVVWYRTTDLTAQTVISWDDSYGAYITDAQIALNGVFDFGDFVAASPGQTVDAQTGAASDQGQADAISFSNLNHWEARAGIFQTVNGQSNRCCVMQLLGSPVPVPGTTEVTAVAPVDTVLLAITVMDLAVGTVVTQFPDKAFLVEMGSFSDGDDAIISYDVTDGWSWDYADGGREVAANADLAALLIQHPTPDMADAT